MEFLTNKRIVLGLTGSIAAYKGAELVRRLKDAGADVQVIMTAAATEFITPLTLQALSGRPVRLHLLDKEAEAAMGHIELARWADLIMVAPASASFLARLGHGEATDLLAAVCLAANCELAVAPAMNRQMWTNPATQDNIRTLRQRGVHIFGPEQGDQACGETGWGRLREPDKLVEDAAALFDRGELQGLRVIVTAGPTREAIDPVRYVSNYSSGKMGYAVATAAMEAGAQVTLVSGPVSLPVPDRVTRVDIESSEDMYDAVMSQIGDCDIFIGTAAAADYRPLETSAHKIKKKAETLLLKLEPARDTIAAVAAHDRAPFTVGFAAETDNIEEHARQKLRNKRLDMIAANDVSDRQLGFASDDNALTVYWDGGRKVLDRAAKSQLARTLIQLIAERYHEKNPA